MPKARVFSDEERAQRNRESASRHYYANQEKCKEQSREWARANPERRKQIKTDPEWGRYIEVLGRYGLTLTDYLDMLAAQGGVCAVCHREPSDQKWGRLAVDHDHVTGQVRGLLCGHCNKAIGLLRDDPSLVSDAATYLASFKRLFVL